MVPVALIIGSTLGAISGFLLWLFAGIGAGVALGIYLGFGIGLPCLAVAVVALRDALSTTPAQESDALTA